MDLHTEARVEKGKGKVPQEPRAVLPSSWTFTPKEPNEPCTVLPGSWTVVSRKPEAEEKVPPPGVFPVLPRGSVIEESLPQTRSGPAHRVYRQCLPPRLGPWRHKQQVLRRTWAHCSSGVTFRGLTGSSCRGSSTASVRLSHKLAANIRRRLSVFPAGALQGLNTTPQMTSFRGAKRVHKMATGKSDDELLQHDN